MVTEHWKCTGRPLYADDKWEDLVGPPIRKKTINDCRASAVNQLKLYHKECGLPWDSLMTPTCKFFPLIPRTNESSRDSSRGYGKDDKGLGFQYPALASPPHPYHLSGRPTLISNGNPEFFRGNKATDTSRKTSPFMCCNVKRACSYTVTMPHVSTPWWFSVDKQKFIVRTYSSRQCTPAAGRVSLVGIPTGYALDGPRIESR
jgi:hypothetical protein